MENKTAGITIEQAREIEIGPVRVKDLPAFIAAVEPFVREAMDGDIFAALAKNADKVIEATAIGSGVKRSVLDEATTDVLVELAARVIEVNADFFAQRVLPAVTTAVERMGQTFGSLSMTGSLPLSAPESTTEA